MLRAHGIVPDFNASTAELKRLIASIDQSDGDGQASHETSPGTGEASHDTPHVTSHGTSPQRLYTTQDSTVYTDRRNDDVRDLKYTGDVDNSASSLLSPDSIVQHLTQWERDRGKAPRFAVTDAPVVAWRVSVGQLRAAYDLALAERHRQRDQSAVNSGFLDAFVAKALAPPRVAVKALRSMTDPELEAEARRLGVSAARSVHREARQRAPRRRCRTVRTERALPLKYALQAGEPWRTVKRYDADEQPFELAQRAFTVAAVRRPQYRWRIVLQPFDVVAADTAWYFDDSYPQHLPLDQQWRCWK
ncbi:hypothetical protein [Burkholderia orbicola]|uniref:hypothetical protein n=1 Tax=Burkholderia orbicola TaxID=2978683 RepID=UPI002FE2FDAC